ncbi:hypothetical protein ACOSQ2_009978 [Xanthoceras sorbifolium]
MVETQFDCKIRNLQSDWGGEYRNISTFLANHGVHHRVSCPYTSEQNGRVERKNRHIVEMGLTLLAHSKVPLSFRLYAFQTSSYLINRLSTSVLDLKTPFEVLYNKIPTYDSLKTLGCACYPFLRPYNNHKLELRSTECVYLGFSSHHKGYLCLDRSSGRVYIS